MPFSINKPQFIIAVVPGRGGLFSLEGPAGQRLLTRSRPHSDAEGAALQAQETSE